MVYFMAFILRIICFCFHYTGGARAFPGGESDTRRAHRRGAPASGSEGRRGAAGKFRKGEISHDISADRLCRYIERRRKAAYDNRPKSDKRGRQHILGLLRLPVPGRGTLSGQRTTRLSALILTAAGFWRFSGADLDGWQGRRGSRACRPATRITPPAAKDAPKNRAALCPLRVIRTAITRSFFRRKIWTLFYSWVG